MTTATAMMTSLFSSDRDNNVYAANSRGILHKKMTKNERKSRNLSIVTVGGILVTFVVLVNVRTHFRFLNITTTTNTNTNTPKDGRGSSSSSSSANGGRGDVQSVLRNSVRSSSSSKSKFTASDRLNGNSTWFNLNPTSTTSVGSSDKNDPTLLVTRTRVLTDQDKIYSKDGWDTSPIVVEKYKLIFFTVPEIGAKTWKQCFRRMEGYDDWSVSDWRIGLPNDPSMNGLKYLYNYTLDEAGEMMTSSNQNWTRAIFIMSPKDRFLSVFRSLKRDRGFVTSRCCPTQPVCWKTLRQMPQFVNLMETCYSSHWAPLMDRLDEKWWPYINFVGSLENVEDDSKRLLEQIGAWDDIGKTGWRGVEGDGGGDGGQDDDRIFASNRAAFDHAREMIGEYSSQVDKILDRYYASDYKSKYFKFKSKGVWALYH